MKKQKRVSETALARKLYIVGRNAARKANDNQGYDRLWRDLTEPSKAAFRAIAAFVMLEL